MIEVLRVLAEGTATFPRRSAATPLARSFKYQLTSNSARSHSSLRFFTRSRIGRPSIGSRTWESHAQARTIPRARPPTAAGGRRLDCDAGPRDSKLARSGEGDDAHRDLERQLAEGAARESRLVARASQARRAADAGDEALRRRRAGR